MKKSLFTLSLVLPFILGAAASGLAGERVRGYITIDSNHTADVWEWADNPTALEEDELDVGYDDSIEETKAGLQTGDVILSVDGKPIGNSGLNEEVIAEIKITDDL